MEPTAFVWMNGELVDWENATIHVGTYGLHYGSGVFEGSRSYESRERSVGPEPRHGASRASAASGSLNGGIT